MQINDGLWGMLRERGEFRGSMESNGGNVGHRGKNGEHKGQRRGTEDVYMVECEYVNQVEFDWRHSEGEGEWLEVNEGQTGIR